MNNTETIADLYHKNEIIDFIEKNSQLISEDQYFYFQKVSEILKLPSELKIKFKETYNFLQELEKHNNKGNKHDFFLHILFSQIKELDTNNEEEKKYFLKLAQKTNPTPCYYINIADLQNDELLNFLIDNFDLNNIIQNNPIELFLKHNGKKINNLKKLLDKHPELFSKPTLNSIDIFTCIVINNANHILPIIDERHIKQIIKPVFINNIIGESELNILIGLIDKGFDPFKVHPAKDILETFIKSNGQKDVIDKIYEKTNTTLLEDILNNSYNILYETYLNNPVVFEAWRQAHSQDKKIIEKIDLEKMLSHNMFLNSLSKLISIDSDILNFKVKKMNVLQYAIKSKNIEAAKLITDINPKLVLETHLNKLPVQTLIGYIDKKKPARKNKTITFENEITQLIKTHLEIISTHKVDTPTLDKSIEDLVSKVEDPIFKSFLNYTKMTKNLSNKTEENITKKAKI